MTTHTIKLPEYVISIPRKGYRVFYFQVPKRLRPEGWPGAIRLGRDDVDGLPSIIESGKSLKIKLDLEKRDSELAIVRKPQEGTFPDIIQKYYQSEYWLTLRPDTKKSYRKYIAKVEEWSKAARHPHVSTIRPRHVFAFLSKYSDRPRERKYLKSILSTLMNQAMIHGYGDNFVKDMDLPQRRDRGDYIIIPWTDDDVKAFMKAADDMGLSSIGRAVLIAYDTGQRQTDVLNYTKPKDYEDGKFKHRQSKTGAHVSIKATKWIRDTIDHLPEGLICPCEATGKRWNPSYFSHRFRDVANAAGLPKHIFKQLRHSHLQILERAGCTDQERNAHSGHSKVSGNAMMDLAYGLERDESLATSAVEKIEKMRETSLKVR